MQRWNVRQGLRKAHSKGGKGVPHANLPYSHQNLCYWGLPALTGRKRATPKARGPIP
jgi:hypothetical protein